MVLKECLLPINGPVDSLKLHTKACHTLLQQGKPPRLAIEIHTLPELAQLIVRGLGGLHLLVLGSGGKECADLLPRGYDSRVSSLELYKLVHQGIRDRECLRLLKHVLPKKRIEVA